MSEITRTLDEGAAEVLQGRRAWIFGELIRQFYRSDSEAGYSFVYVWLTNQFGHFMIGFAGTLFAGWAAALLGLIPLPGAVSASAGLWDHLWPAVLVGAVWLGGWLAKEAFDIRLAANELAKAQRLRGAADGIGSLEAAGFWRSVVGDSLADVFFYSAGFLTVIAMHAGAALGVVGWAPWVVPALPFMTFLFLLAVALAIMPRWLREKLSFDIAGLPFVARFVLNDRPADQATRDRVFRFVTERRDPGHLVIVGPPKSGRTTIAVSLGVEAVLQPDGPKVAYTTLAKLLDDVWEQTLPAQDDAGRTRRPDRKPVRPAEDAELLIVDDVGARGAKGAFVAADDFAAELRSNHGLHRKCANKRVIWVVGDDPDRDHDWIAALQDAFGASIHVETIKLPIPIKPEHRHQLLRR